MSSADLLSVEVEGTNNKIKVHSSFEDHGHLNTKIISLDFYAKNKCLKLVSIKIFTTLFFIFFSA